MTSRPIVPFVSMWYGLRRHAALLLVIASLCWLAAVTLYVQGRVAALLQELSYTIEPGTRAVTDLQLALSTEGASTRGYLLTGEPGYAAGFQKARTARRRSLARLLDLSPAVPGLRELVTHTDATLREADELLDWMYTGRMSRDEYLVQFPLQHRRFSEVTAEAASFQHTLRSRAGERRETIRRTQRAGTFLTLAGVVLGVAASYSVGRLNNRLRALREREQAARTAMEAAHIEAAAQQKQVERMAQARTSMIRGFSHDLRNPLGAADGYLFMLEEGVMGALTSAQCQAVGMARRGVRDAVALTEDLVELARAASADVDLELAPMDLCAVATAVVEEYRGQADARQLVMATDIPSLPVLLTSDRVRVAQILGNLLNNAIKYTAHGTITVRVGVNGDIEEAEAFVAVSDTGPGIAEEDLDRIFEEFERADPSAAKGAGIGLAISRRLATLLGGRILLQSEVGRGSTFTLRLPLAPPPGA